MIQTALQKDIFLLSFELGNSKWLLTFTNGQRVRRREISARDLGALDAEISRARVKLESTAHLGANFAYLLMFGVLVLMYPASFMFHNSWQKFFLRSFRGDSTSRAHCKTC